MNEAVINIKKPGKKCQLYYGDFTELAKHKRNFSGLEKTKEIQLLPKLILCQRIFVLKIGAEYSSYLTVTLQI